MHSLEGFGAGNQPPAAERELKRARNLVMNERRGTTRYSFGAIAEVIDLGSRRKLVGITRDLSLSGCFVKTATPFAEGTLVWVRITFSGEFAGVGKVTSDVTSAGMGIEFVEIAPSDSSDHRKLARLPGHTR